MANDVQHAERLGEAPRQRSHVPAVDSACRILHFLVRNNPRGISLSELSRELGVSKSTIHGLLATLHAHGFVQRDPDSRLYRLGSALVTLGSVAATQLRAAALVSDRLSALAAEHGLTFAVAQVTGYSEAQVIDRAYPASDVHVGLTLGSRYGVFDGAIGKCLLATVDADVAARLIRQARIPKHTDRTIADPEALIAEVARVRARGWGASEGEFKENHAVAAPLLVTPGDVQLIVFAVGFASQLSAKRIRSIGKLLVETNTAVATALGVSADRDRHSSEL